MKNAQVNAWAFFILKLIFKMFYSEKYENMSNNKQNNQQNNEKCKCSECLCITSITVSGLAIFAAAIYHVYLSIAGLAGVSNGDIRELCNSSTINTTSDYTYIGEDPSEIWMYVLMSLLFVSGGIINNTKSLATEKEDGTKLTIPEAMCSINCSAILFGGFCGWGWDQIWNSGTCLEHNFGNETLMTSARIHFYIQAVVCGLIALFDIILILGFIGALMYDKCCQKLESPPVSGEEHLRQVITGETTTKNDGKGLYGASQSKVSEVV